MIRIGDRVHVPSVGTGTVREIRNGARYLIEIKGRPVLVSAGQLERAEAPAGERRRRPSGTTAAVSPDPHPGPAVVRSLDLHGRTVLEAVEALDAFLNDALADGADELRVIHGRSGTKLKSAVHARLTRISSIRGFRVDPTNPGVTIVSL